MMVYLTARPSRDGILHIQVRSRTIGVGLELTRTENPAALMGIIEAATKTRTAVVAAAVEEEVITIIAVDEEAGRGEAEVVIIEGEEEVREEAISLLMTWALEVAATMRKEESRIMMTTCRMAMGIMLRFQRREAAEACRTASENLRFRKYGVSLEDTIALNGATVSMRLQLQLQR